MEAKHTKEPWKFDVENYGVDRRAGYGLIALVDGVERSLGVTVNDARELVSQKDGRPDSEVQANAARIVACVNACEGIPDPTTVGEVVDLLRNMTMSKSWRERRDAALAKLEGK